VNVKEDQERERNTDHSLNHIGVKWEEHGHELLPNDHPSKTKHSLVHGPPPPPHMPAAKRIQVQLEKKTRKSSRPSDQLRIM
jgi:hypothetical protein